MSIIFCGVSPHPPIVVPQVGGDETAKVKATQEALQQLAEKVKESGADTLIIISPHGFVFQDGIGINGSIDMEGSFAQFGAPQVAFKVHNDLELVKRIQAKAARMGIPTAEIDGQVAKEYGFQAKLDHGVLVPYYFLDQAGLKIPVVSISVGLLPFEDLYAFGVALERAAQVLNKKVALIASADLSHRLIPDAPAGYDPEAETFDRLVVEAIGNGDAEALVKLDGDLIEKAGECGLRSMIMMMGALDGRTIEAKVLSYQGPFGVGYLVATLVPGEGQKPNLMEKFYAERESRIKAKRSEESPLVTLARTSLELYIRKGEILAAAPCVMMEELYKEAGVFVSIKKHGQLRGCIGTTAPTQPSVVQEIISNAISAGIHDPRFLPIEEEELEDLEYSVDVLAAPEAISSPEELDPQKYGVIVRSGSKTGLLLPNLEGINSIEEQLAIAKQKAGIEEGELVELQRFEVVRYK